MLASALCCGERDESGCRLGQRPLNELWLTLEELVVFCIEDQRRSGNALRYTGQGVVLCFAEQVGIRSRRQPATLRVAPAATPDAGLPGACSLPPGRAAALSGRWTPMHWTQESACVTSLADRVAHR